MFGGTLSSRNAPLEARRGTAPARRRRGGKGRPRRGCPRGPSVATRDTSPGAQGPSWTWQTTLLSSDCIFLLLLFRQHFQPYSFSRSKWCPIRQFYRSSVRYGTAKFIYFEPQVIYFILIASIRAFETISSGLINMDSSVDSYYFLTIS